MFYQNKQLFEQYVFATRRIFHIQTKSDSDERVQSEDFCFGGHGSGILLKHDMRFFLLTAKHTLSNSQGDINGFDNTSPFRIQTSGVGGFENTLDFLYPKKAWFIADLIPDHDVYKVEDVILIELSSPLLGQKVDHYLHIDELKVLELKDFKDGMPVLDIGYSSLSNEYDFKDLFENWGEESQGIVTHSTQIKRDLVKGELKYEKTSIGSSWILKKKNYEGKSTDGMSGGLIVTILPNGESKAIGIHLMGAEQSNIIRFLPLCLVVDTIKSYKNAKSLIIDYVQQERLKTKEGVITYNQLFKNYLADKKINFDELSRPENQGKFNVLMALFLVNHSDMLVVASEDREKNVGQEHDSDIIRMMIESAKKYLLSKDWYTL
ncbi:hypothetical protein [Acinetobacter baumannii]